MDWQTVSRRDFCRSALAASSLVAAGLPSRALAVALADRTPTNVRVSHDGHDDHIEPCLAVDPGDSHNLLAACALETSGPSGPATYTSFDAGRTWRSNGPLPLPEHIDGGGDLTAGFAGASRALVCGLLSLDPSVAPKGTGFSVHVWGTEDGGRTFTPSVTVSRIGVLDKPSLATEHRAPHGVHVVWTEAKPLPTPDPASPTTLLKYARSTDRGRTFEAPRTIAHHSDGLGDVMVACGRGGNVYVIYHIGRGGGSPPVERTIKRRLENPATVKVLRSQDHGRTFERPIELGQSTIELAFPDTESSSLPAIAADPQSGLVCAAFCRHAEGARHSDILLTASRDGGHTWARAKVVTPHDRLIYFQPQLAIDAAGRIGILAFTIDDGKVSVVLMLSEPHSLRFGPPITITHHPFDPTKSEFGRRWFIGDYQALATTPGFFHPLWNDTRTGRMQLFTAAIRARG